ncbi:MAG: hypothetical protein DHS20C16_02790 [Phycisphaerae bacterium]|nr:MAG: hypothetical protein DHS20C16_02790 [Phycisphaerae bacterium]
MKKKEVMSVSVSPRLREALSEVAEARGVSRSALVERLLHNGVVEERKELKLLENPIFQALGIAVAKLPGVMEFASKMAGEDLSKEELTEMRTLIQEQIDRGKRRANAKGPGPVADLEGGLA